MPAFVFLGGPDCGDATETVAFGAVFHRGAPSEVSDEYAIRKLRRHPHFREVEAGIPSGVELPEPYSEDLPAPVKRRGRPPRV